MIQALTIRESIQAILEAVSPDLAGDVTPQRLDVVERLPAAAVYLSNIECEPVARAQVERTASIAVEITRRAEDVERVLLTEAEAIESAVYAARKSLAPAVKRVHLASVDLERDTQDQRRATLVATFAVKTAESIT